MTKNTQDQRPIYGAVLQTPLGPMTLRELDQKLIALDFCDFGLRDETPLLKEASAQLQAYFSQKLRVFDLPLHFESTAFRQAVWQALLTIPYGQTISYRALSERVGAPRAYRAVGNANGRNPLPIFIPCHRVIAHDGSLGGYSGGLGIKVALLSLEGLSFSEPKKK